jgi:Glycosyltransferase family 87
MTHRPARTHRATTWTTWLVLAATLAVSASWKGLCLDRAGWSEAIQYRLFCYSDITALWFTRDFAEGLLPYLQDPLEYPTLIGLQIGLISSAVRALGGDVGWFFSLNAVVNAASAAGILHLLRRNGLGERQALWWAASPPLLLYAFHNWDLPALAALVWAVTLHREGRDTRSGVAAGLGVSGKLLPVLAIPLFALARSRQRRFRAATAAVAGAAAAWIAANLPVALAAPDAWSRFFVFSSERGTTTATLWAVLSRAGVLSADIETVNLLSAMLFAAGATGIVLVGIRRHPAPATWALTVPLLAWFLLTNKVYSPQFDLWLVPLMVLAGRRWSLAAFFVVDACAFLGEFGFLGDRMPYPLLAIAVVARALVLGWIVVESLLGGAGGAAAPQRQDRSHIRASEIPAGRETPYRIGEK